MAATGSEKSFCVLEFHSSKSVITVQRAFRLKFHKDSPSDNSIRAWYRQFNETGCLCKRKSTGRPSTSDAIVDSVRESFIRSPSKSTASAGRELGIPKTTVWRVLRKRLLFKPYHLQLLQHLSDGDKTRRHHFCLELQQKVSLDEGFLEKIIFSDEATFHISGKVNRHNVRVWGSENPHAYVEHVRDSPKVNVFCAISREAVYGPFFFAETTVNGMTYLDMLQLWLMPQLLNDFIFQQDGCPAHFHNEVRRYLNTTLPRRWIGRASEEDQQLLLWPPRSPDLTPCDFFLWGYVKDKVFTPPMPNDIAELKDRIIIAVNSIERDMLGRVWQELDFRVDVCRVTKGAHIEDL